jgi:hypothetical protein
MQTQLTKLIEEMQHRAKTCEAAAQDETEEALTGESNASELHKQHASEWLIKSKVWQEAEEVARGLLPGTNGAEPDGGVCPGT